MLLAGVAGKAMAAGEVNGPRLQLEVKIPLGNVRGRIDHLSVDVARGRLFVAELGNDTVGVVDLQQRRVARRLSGFREPQGVLWSAEADTLYVASGGDGTVRAFTGENLAAGPAIDLGSDADNVRLGSDAQVLVGAGSGAVATLDGRTLHKDADIQFSGHPESFQLERHGTRVFVNDPGAHQLLVLDRGRGEVVARWHQEFSANYPMALDENTPRIFVVFRSPAVMEVLSTKDGGTLGSVPVCGDADDVFLDERRAAAYVVCGVGRVEVFETRSASFKKVSTFQTVAGARTGLFVPDLDRLFVAVRASGSEPASIWILRPVD